jgi:ketosteroid isomerase-like protein
MNGSNENVRVVERYFTEVIDGRDLSVLAELFDPSCLIHRADLPEPLVGFDHLRAFLAATHQAIERTATEFLHVVAGETGVAVHLRHDVKFREWVVTPVGLVHADGREVSWLAIAMFELRDGRITEERVVRDELSILKQLDMLPAEWFAARDER